MNQSLTELLKKCTESEEGYIMVSENIAAFVKDQTKQIKIQMPIVDYIKVTIKSKKHTSHQKLLALEILNKCMLQRNTEFNKYVIKKFLKRLSIMAEHNKEKSSEADMLTKGENIFSSDEKDKKHAAYFLIILLHFIEIWAQLFPLADDLKNTSHFEKTYQGLLKNKVTFPSSFKNADVDQIIQESAFLQQRVELAIKAEKQVQTNIRIQKKLIINELKNEMLKAKEISRKCKEYLSKLEKIGYMYESVDLITIFIELETGRDYCEHTIKQLTNEKIGKSISNVAELLDQLLQFQVQIVAGINILTPYVQEVKKKEIHLYSKLTQKQQQSGSQPKSINILEVLDKLDFGPPKVLVEKQIEDSQNDITQMEEQGKDEQNQNENYSIYKMFDKIQNSKKLDPLAQEIKDSLSRPIVEENKNKEYRNDYNNHSNGYYNNQQQVVQDEQQYQDPIYQNQVSNNYDEYQYPSDSYNNNNYQQEYQEPYQDNTQYAQESYQYQHNDQQINNNLDQQQQDYNQDYNQQNYQQQDQPYYENENTTEQQFQESNGGNIGVHNLCIDDFKVERQVKKSKDELTILTEENQKLRKKCNQLEDDIQMIRAQGDTNSDYYELYISLQSQHRYLEETLEQTKTYFHEQLIEKDHQLKIKNEECQSFYRQIQQLKQQLAQQQSKGSNLPYQNDEALAQKMLVEPAIIKNNSIQNPEVPLPGKIVRKQSSIKTVQNVDETKQFSQTSQAPYQQQEQIIPQQSTNYQQPPIQMQQEQQQNRNSITSNQQQMPVRSSQKSLEQFFFKGLFSDKCVIFEDQNVQLGSIRFISKEWRQAVFKIYIGNKSANQEIKDLNVTTMSENVAISCQETMSSALAPKGQREIKVIVSGQLDQKPTIFLSYNFGEQPSGDLRIRLSANPLFFSEPLRIQAGDFNQLFDIYRNKREEYFNMDLHRAGNLQQLKSIMSINDKHTAFIQGINSKPNIVGFAGQHLEGQILFKVEVSANGKNCKLEIATEFNTDLIQGFVETVLDLISQK